VRATFPGFTYQLGNLITACAEGRLTDTLELGGGERA
jgi:hypothetical protein